MAIQTRIRPPVPAVVRRSSGELRLTHPTRGYAVTRNPFAVWWVLPGITLAFAAVAMTTALVSDPGILRIAAGAFSVVCLGLLLVSAVTLKGSLNLSHDGVTFERGRDHLTAGWDEIVGIVHRRDAGLCLVLRNPQQTRDDWKLAGGFRSHAGSAVIPLRYFGDRQFSILYDIRDHLPEQCWRPALLRAERATGSTLRCQLVYAGTVAAGGLAAFAAYLIVTR